MGDTPILTIALASVPTVLLVVVNILINNSRLSDTTLRLSDLRIHADHRFDGYRMPPIELSVDVERHPASEAFRKLGIAKPEKGVFAVSEVEPRS